MSELREVRAAVVGDGSLRGRALCRALAAATDGWLAERFAEAAGDDPSGLALVAVGGHGRGSWPRAATSTCGSCTMPAGATWPPPPTGSGTPCGTPA